MHSLTYASSSIPHIYVTGHLLESTITLCPLNCPTARIEVEDSCREPCPKPPTKRPKPQDSRTIRESRNPVETGNQFLISYALRRQHTTFGAWHNPLTHMLKSSRMLRTPPWLVQNQGLAIYPPTRYRLLENQQGAPAFVLVLALF